MSENKNPQTGACGGPTGAPVSEADGQISLDGASVNKNVTARAALFVDGFNMYHAIDDLKDPFLKWLNLWELGSLIIPQRSQTLVSVDFCTATYPGDHKKWIRHNTYLRALESVQVRIHPGHYIMDDRTCPSPTCKHTWQRPAEKQSDINLALAVFNGARNDEFDHGYILSADSDQVATALWMQRCFPEKALTMVVPPGRIASKEIRDRTKLPSLQLTASQLERCLFGPFLPNNGKGIKRPFEYDPPAGWVHPSQRP